MRETLRVVTFNDIHDFCCQRRSSSTEKQTLLHQNAMLHGLDCYRYYHKLAHTCVLLSTQLYRQVDRWRWERIATNSNGDYTEQQKCLYSS